MLGAFGRCFMVLVNVAFWMSILIHVKSKLRAVGSKLCTGWGTV